MNFWPNMDLDAYIGLERSVSGKMKLLDVSATGEENIIDVDAGDRMNDLEYRRKQLEALQSRVVDLEDLNSGVAITDMTLNDLRLDLAQMSPDARDALSLLQPAVYAPVPASDDLPPGALFVLRAATPAALAAIDAADPLRPHALVYVGMDETVVLPPSQPKRALDLLRLASALSAEAQADAWKRFDKATRSGDRMETWQRLLSAAIKAVTGKAEERAVESLFTSGGTAGAGVDPGLEDWEVVSWLAVLPRMADDALIDRVVEALVLPPFGRVDRRIPKTVLSEHGASTAAQRKMIDGAVERLDWLATLSPATAGIAAGTDAERPVSEVQLLALTARTELTQALLTLIHRAIPYPVLLLTTLPSQAVRVSLAPLRHAERLHERKVVERLVVAPNLTSPLDAVAKSFVASLDIGGLPQTNLGALYESLVQRVEAFAAARLSGADLRLPRDATEATARQEGLARHSAIETAWIAARAAARKEKRLAHQVALAEQARMLEKELKALAARLA